MPICPATPLSQQAVKVRQRRVFVAIFIAALLVLLTITAGAWQQGGSGPQRPQTGGVRPKSTPTRARAPKAETKSKKSGGPDSAQAPSLPPTLASADFDLIGLAATAAPSGQTVPKNTATVVNTSVDVPEGNDPTAIIAGLDPNYRVRGELVGPSLPTPLTIEAAIGQPLRIPPLPNAGDHLLQNLRVVDVGTANQPIIAGVTPDTCGITVIERLFVSEVRVSELTYEQIVQAGINLSPDNYNFFNFNLGLGTSAGSFNINIPVAFPTLGNNIALPPVVGNTQISTPGLEAPLITPPFVAPIMLEGEDEEGGRKPLVLPGGGGNVNIPGLVVFPGRIGLLHQFFEAIVIVGNGAPNGTPLVIRNLRARALLPDNATPGNVSDDPLRIAVTQTGGAVSELELHGLGADRRYGTGDDTLTFAPGQSGQAAFLLEGLREGLHTVNFDLSGMLDGLPGGPVRVRGSVPGAVLVRDASFSVAFTHPSVVRSGQEYDLGLTLYNSGNTNINAALANLSPNSIIGATLVGAPQQSFPATIPRGQSGTIKWRLRATTTGQVTASYVKVGENISAGLNLVTGVGDRNVPLSPDSLILPEAVKELPPEIIEPARELLGQAWSVANAPSGSLPEGVAPVSQTTVVDRAVQLGLAGLRIRFGEPQHVSVDTALRDWLGELETNPDSGFADTMRNTVAGYHWQDSVGAYFNRLLTANSQSPNDLMQDLANAEAPRNPFIAALATQAGGPPLFGARLANGGGQIGWGANAGERFGDFRGGAALPLQDANGVGSGQMLLVSRPAGEDWTLHLTGWANGAADIRLLIPNGAHSYRLVTLANVTIIAGRQYRIAFRLNSSQTLRVEENLNGVWTTVNGVGVSSSAISEPAPRLVGAIQVTPDVLPGGDNYGRIVGLLFSKPMDKTTGQTRSRYQIGGGTLTGSNPPANFGDPVKVFPPPLSITGQEAYINPYLDYGDRFIFAVLNHPVGPFVDRHLSLNGLTDKRNVGLAAPVVNRPLGIRVSPQAQPPGSFVSGGPGAKRRRHAGSQRSGQIWCSRWL